MRTHGLRSSFGSSFLHGLASLSLVGMLGCATNDVDDASLVPPVRRAAYQSEASSAGKIVFAEVVANGTGCPPGTAVTRISEDGLVFTTTFANYVALVTPENEFSLRDCQLAIKLATPSKRTSFSVQTFSYSGYALLEEGVIGRQQATYYYQGTPVAPVETNRDELVGPYNAPFVFKDQVEESEEVWSPCDVSRDLNVVTRLQILNSTPRRAGYMNLSSIDGSQRLILTLRMRSCDAPPEPPVRDKPSFVRVTPTSVDPGQSFLVRWLPPEDADAATTYRVQLHDEVGPLWESPATQFLTMTYAGPTLPIGPYQVIVVAKTATRTSTSDPVKLEVRSSVTSKDGGPPPVPDAGPAVVDAGQPVAKPVSDAGQPGIPPVRDAGAPPIPPAPDASVPVPPPPTDTKQPDEGPTWQQLDRQCSAGSLQACADLGLLYDRGEGVKRDVARAFALFKRACDGGLSFGCYKLGDYYYDGTAAARNYAQAFAMYSRACDAGFMGGCDMLGYLYVVGHGVARNYVRAIELFTRACDAGTSHACHNLGLLHAAGQGVAQNYARAATLFERACDGGIAISCNELGVGYERGWAGTVDLRRATGLYLQACEGGEPTGCANLASCYERGAGVAHDLTRALEFYRRACAGGDTEACTKVTRLQAGTWN